MTTDTETRTALVTGANSGLGKAIAHALASRGLRVGMVARDRIRGEAALDEIRTQTGNADLHLFLADLSDQAQIRDLAAQVLDRFDHLHVLVNNAGTAFPERRLSPDGIECALAVNHLAPFLLTQLLLERLKDSAPARILNVGTRINTAMDFSDLNWERRPYRLMRAYGQSKLGNLHYTFELSRRLSGTRVAVNCVFPGVFRSNLGGTDGAQGLFWKLVDRLIGWALPSPEAAARPLIELALSPEWEDVSGDYLAKGRRLRPPAQTLDPNANRQLWTLSEQLTGLASPSS
ncbi:short-chain dehydrogenase/reductase SDR [Thiorhodococcus drewsii AZ1]|uniref:Short-chain dehydrogenase/reductase SDR n=1 Tax=Thiorhodococcus drewsii AZ1 TaxID=765913 RepID=G2E155_9GAMM|nr:SDR family NAD(P)-dependent oxidoreductase [Thiorhodococcus drewsii]EGV31396.1 short-chain dehydrogenase/reductase SDR [Thiorhodococcus drewsii AZ1]